MIITTIDLLRHGEVEGGSCYRGSTNHALTPTGWLQMHNAVARSIEWQVVGSSPLRRCLDFAKEFSEQKQLPLFVANDFQEICFGEWEGKTAEQINAQDLRRFYSPPFDYAPPKGESVLDFQRRVVSAWQAVLKHQQGNTILLITHAGVIRILFSFLLKIPIEKSFAIEVGHASLTRFTCFHSGNDDFVKFNFHLPLLF